MNPHPDDERDPTAAEAAFVRRVAEVYALPPRTAAQRVAFQAALDERLRRRGRRTWLRLAAATVGAAAATVLVMYAVPERAVEDSSLHEETVAVDPTPAGAEVPLQEDAILTLAMGSETNADEALPADYEAIAGAFLTR